MNPTRYAILHWLLFAGILFFALAGLTVAARAQEAGPAGRTAGRESLVTCALENGPASNAAAFKPYALLNCGREAYGVAAGDFNHDGRMDAALSTVSGVGYAHELLVFLQGTDRALAQPAVYPGGNRSEYLAAGDFNHDGRDDLATADWFDNTISVYLQQSDGTLAGRVTYATNSGPDSIAVGDVNDDTRDDILVAHSGNATIGVFTQKADGTLNAMVTYPSVAAGYDDIAAGDVNGDGRTDVVKMNGQGYANPHFMVYLQNAGRTLNPAANYSIAGCTQCLANGVAVGDVTGDGKSDVVVAYGLNSPSSKIAVFRQSNGALLASVSYPSLDVPEAIEVADLDSDSRQDVAVLHGGWHEAGVYTQQEYGALGSESLYLIPYKSSYYSQDLAIGDINGDGLPDLLIADGQGLVVLYRRLPTPVPISPSTKISDRTPTYTWVKVGGAAQYRYQVMKGPALLYTRTVDAAACGASTCSNTPTVPLGDGSYTWSAALLLNGVWGDYGAAKSFSVDAVPDLMTPAGVISDPTPTYKWAKVIGATDYQFQLAKGTTAVYTKLVGSAACSASVCTNTPALPVLADGSYKWGAQARIGGIWQPYSLYKTFSLKTVPAPQSPSGSIPDATPTYKWNRIAGATQYRYEVRKGAALVYTKTVGATACGAASCSNTPATVLTYNVSHKWRVQALVAGAWRPYSAYMTFMPNNKPRAGLWKSADGFDLFYVTPDQSYVDEYTITVDVLGCGTYMIRHSEPAAIINHQFSFNSSGFYVNGTFATTTSMTGTDGLNDYYIDGCGYVNGGPWDFAATWQSASHPLTSTVVPGGPVDIIELIRGGLGGLIATHR